MTRVHVTRWLVVCVTLTWAASAAWGQDDVDVQVEDEQQAQQQDVQQQEVQRQRPNRAQQRLERAQHVHRASELIGMEVKNAQGEDLGELHDLVVGMRSGRIRYAALSFGGFAGLGEKLFAIPFQGLQLTTGEDDEKYFVLNIPTEQFENAQGFEENNWPDTANPQWAAQIDNRYQIEARTPRRDSQQRQTDEETTDQARQPDQAARGQRRGRQGGDVGIRLSKVRGMNVRNASNQEIGEIEDLVIDGQRGRVRYAALAFGETLGLGGKLFAIPWNRFQLGQQDEEYHLVLNVTEQELERAQGFDSDAWPNTADPQWQQRVEENFPRQRPERRAERPERSEQQ